MRVLIVGGGITGLAAAWALARQVGERAVPMAIHLVESQTRLGGKILTEREDGFIVEGGPDAFISLKPAAARLCRELGMGDDIVGTDPAHQKTFIVRRGRLIELPGGMNGFVPTRWGPFITTPLLSWRAKMRMGLEPLIPRRVPNPDESMAGFFSRRLGREAYDWLVEPLLAGIYAGNGEQLGLAGTFPRFLDMEREHGGLLRASLAAKAAARAQGDPKKNGAGAGAGPSSLFLSLKGGLAALIERLDADIRQAGVTLSTGVAVTEVAFEGPGNVDVTLSDGTTWRGDAILLTTPAFDAADLIGEQVPDLGALLREIPYVSTATVSMAFAPGTPDLDVGGYGFVIPHAESRALQACTWTSSKWRERAPAGWALVRCYLGADGDEAILDGTDADLAAGALAGIHELMRFTASPQRTWVHRWPRAMPQYRVGHLDRMAAVDAAAARVPGLYLAGAAYHGIGIPDCISDGRRAAERILTTVSSTPAGAGRAG